MAFSVKVLLSNGSYGIIEAVRAIHYDKPQATYNFEVAEFHTYYVAESNVLVHNHCNEWTKERRRYWKEQGAKYQNSINKFEVSDTCTYRLTERNIKRMLKGKAPIGIDGFSVHLHHTVGKSVDMYQYIEVVRSFYYKFFKLLHWWLFWKVFIDN